MAVNDTAGPRGPVPSLLVFGIQHRVPTDTFQIHKAQYDRIRAAQLVRLEFNRIVSAERVRLASRAPVTPATDAIYKPGDLVYAYRKRLRRYTCPHMNTTFDSKQVRLHIGDSKGPRSFNSAVVRPSPLPNAYAPELSEPKIESQIMYTDILPVGEKREILFDEAKREETLGLIKRDMFRIVLQEECEENSNVVRRDSCSRINTRTQRRGTQSALLFGWSQGLL